MIPVTGRRRRQKAGVHHIVKFSQNVERVVSRKPISFDEFARDHAAAWK